MKPQWKPVPDVTIYIEDYAAYVANPTHEEEHKWDILWEKLSQSQRDKLTNRAREFNDQAEL